MTLATGLRGHHRGCLPGKCTQVHVARANARTLNQGPTKAQSYIARPVEGGPGGGTPMPRRWLPLPPHRRPHIAKNDNGVTGAVGTRTLTATNPPCWSTALEHRDRAEPAAVTAPACPTPLFADTIINDTVHGQ